MPDYDPTGGQGEGPIRRPARGPRVRRYGPGGLPTEGADPAPKPWPIAPWIALLLIVGFLALQLWPETHFRHPKDPSRTWVPIVRDSDGNVDHHATAKEAQKLWFRNSGQVDPDADVETWEVGDEEGTRVTNENLEKQQDVHIFLSTDETDLRPLVVVMNSTMKNAKNPERIKFHLVIPSSASRVEKYQFWAFLPDARIDIIRGNEGSNERNMAIKKDSQIKNAIFEGFDFDSISKLISYKEDSKARKELTTPYNFLLYYLPALLQDKDIDKIIYLDTDAVVKQDIEELYRQSLDGRPIAAVEDCSQQFETYFNFKQLNEIYTRQKVSVPWLPQEPFNPEECVFNRGALVIDVKKWIAQNVTEKIEWWLNEFRSSETAVYKYGLSQPPFLLALYRNYKHLGYEWNVRGLGRDRFSEKELDFFEANYNHRPEKKPFVSPASDYAKILHFNGKFKPWKRGRVRLPHEPVVALCGAERKECDQLWWEYISEKVDVELNGTSP